MNRISGLVVTPLTIIALLGLVSCSNPPVSAGPFTYYVSADGDDSANGLNPESAWKTLDRASTQQLKPGDTLVLTGNDSLAGELKLDSTDAGDPTKPVRITSDDSFPSIVAENSAGIAVVDTSGVTIEDLAITVASDDSEDAPDGIRLYASEESGQHSSVVIRNVHIAGAYNGIAVSSDSVGDGFDEVSIESVEISDSIRNGIIIHGPDAPDYGHSNLHISDSIVSGTTGISGLETNSGSGIVIGSVQDAVIERNEAFDNGRLSDANEGPIGIWTYNSTRVLIRNNRSHDNKSQLSDGGGFGFDISTTDSTLESNYSYNNAGPGFLLIAHQGGGSTGGNIVRYNASIGDSSLNAYHGGISVIGGFSEGDYVSQIEDTIIHHNTVFPAPSSGAAALKLRGNIVGLSIHHNILDTSAGDAPSVAAVDVTDDSEISIVANQLAVNPYTSTPVFDWNGARSQTATQAESLLHNSFDNFEYTPIYPGGFEVSTVLETIAWTQPVAVSADVPEENTPSTSDLAGNPVEEPNPYVGAINPETSDQNARRQNTFERR
ncbi:right-handed parallel beta-helix repeat-containing protein [Corynebacterium glutamicum]|uniref:right-handed parallel beta-helix repeat-containing protein n=1 Tax=Corynebacterium glutamicum TaxID=1718 RepID=UPI001C6F598C|nr:right-handed parallel beta-helix repeat-containing protein [Corynebacterium glutamicum]QYR18060.1 right-handed parallel beta-helix repeat-containing protein [Corynebacterium glutamicum]